MKLRLKLLTIALFIVSGIFSQTLPLQYDTVKQIRSGKYLKSYLNSGDTWFSTNQGNFQFNKSVIIPSGKLFKIGTDTLPIWPDIRTYVSTHGGGVDTTKTVASGHYGTQYDLSLKADTTAEWVTRTIYVSMPTDPQTPGSDVSGTGSVSLPYATLRKAISSIKKGGIFAPLTIQLDSGNFSYSGCKQLLINLLYNSVASSSFAITIKGQTVRETQYPALTYSTTPTPFLFKVSGYSFTENELQDKYTGNLAGTGFWPIESNRNDSVYIPAESLSTYTYPYRFNTVLTSTTDVSDYTFSDPGTNYGRLRLFTLKMTNTTSKVFTGITAWYCTFNNTGNNSTTFQNTYVGWGKVTSVSTNQPTLRMSGINDITQMVIYNNGTRKTNGAGVYFTSNNAINSCIISGYNNALQTGENVNLQGHRYLLFKDCGTCVTTSMFFNNTCINLSTLGIGVIFSNYLFYSGNDNLPVKFNTNTYNFVNLISIYNPSSLYKSFVREDLGGYINGLGLYTEVQRKLSASLVNNTTDSISIGDKSYNRTIEIKYTALRGSTYRKGTLEIINTGSGLTFNPGSYFPVTDIGLTFTGAYYSGSSNTIKLEYTVDNSGGNVTLTYDAFRQNY